MGVEWFCDHFSTRTVSRCIWQLVREFCTTYSSSFDCYEMTNFASFLLISHHSDVICLVIRTHFWLMNPAYGSSTQSFSMIIIYVYILMCVHVYVQPGNEIKNKSRRPFFNTCIHEYVFIFIRVYRCVREYARIDMSMCVCLFFHSFLLSLSHHLYIYIYIYSMLPRLLAVQRLYRHFNSVSHHLFHTSIEHNRRRRSR